MRISSIFSFYGGKSKIVNCYHPPKYGKIIEPFAGAAAYAWRWHDREVWINDQDPRIYALWRFLLSPDALAMVREYVPLVVKAGQKIAELLPEDAPEGLRELMRAEANQGTQGATGVHDQITSMGARCWNILPKMEVVIPAIAHWVVTNLPHEKVEFTDPATWFIDPPYNNAAGRRYRVQVGDYDQLAQYCQSRPGQVIVCENMGATWLPFAPLEHRRVSIRSRYQKADAKEVVFTCQN